MLLRSDMIEPYSRAVLVRQEAAFRLTAWFETECRSSIVQDASPDIHSVEGGQIIHQSMTYEELAIFTGTLPARGEDHLKRSFKQSFTLTVTQLTYTQQPIGGDSRCYEA